jgi:hypothetical protein
VEVEQEDPASSFILDNLRIHPSRADWEGGLGLADCWSLAAIKIISQIGRNV